MEQTKIIKKKNRLSFLAAIPSVFTALLPKFVCPICWPLYAGILSSLGISLTNYSQYLLPVMLAFLGIALFSLAFKAKQRRGYYPFLLGALASMTILIGKFEWHSNIVLYAGVILLISASLWNAWPKRKNSITCGACKKA